MKPDIPTILPAIAILIGGFIVVRYQRSEITGLKSSASSNAMPAARDANIRNPLSKPTATSVAVPPRPAEDAGEAHAAAFLESFRDKAKPLIEKMERDAAGARARHKAGRIALLLGLNPSEASSLHTHLENQGTANLNAAARNWIAKYRDEKAVAKYDDAEAASRIAAIEHNAQEAIFRLSRLVDLTPEQKDRLFAAFVRKAADAPAVETAPYDLRIAFSHQDTPSIASPDSLARPLLTPEQVTFFDAALEQEKTAIAGSTQAVAGQLLPRLLTALQEAAGQKQ
jgi:hypothetical protein